MPQPTSLRSYEVEAEVMNRALASEHGVKVEFPDQAKATNFVQRANALRSRQRKLSISMFEEGDPRRGTCDYDTVRILRRGNFVILYSTAAYLATMTITELEEPFDENDS